MTHTAATHNGTQTLTPIQAERAIERTYKAQQAQDNAARDRAAERLMQLIVQKTGQDYTTAAQLKAATSTTARVLVNA